MIDGKALREYREAAGLSLQKLADDVGTKPQYLFRAEKGEKDLSLAIACAVAKRLGVKVDDLVRHDIYD